MAAPKGLPGIIAKWTNSGKSGCIADEADASRTPNGNKGDAARMCIGCQPKYTRYIPDTNALSVLNTLYTRCICLHPFSVLLTMYRRSMYCSGCELRGCPEDAERIQRTFNG